ncbi:hypothetical protein [Acidiphilium cryptum]|uniref:Uncharacterized protein n=1 Tax=Acidiphilium cryptum (strain JF-5) TaxID=349163 RepID=A5FUA6_ACICJ|nr:hypothetical protein [Acidiphilium cryptum]ABQ29188.1 hypothetical protein Acry_3592 [Acidiphilium cryptum JF-5]
MAKNSREGNQSRKKRYYEALAERGIRPVQVLAPESAHPLIRQAAGLMTREDDPLEPRAALRRAGGANEPESGEASPALAVELEAAKARIAEIERQAEALRVMADDAAERQRRALEVEQEKAQASAEEAQKAAISAQVAEGRAAEALRRAEKAEAAIRQAKAMPGIKGRLVRFLAGDVLK